MVFRNKFIYYNVSINRNSTPNRLFSFEKTKQPQKESSLREDTCRLDKECLTGVKLPDASYMSKALQRNSGGFSRDNKISKVKSKVLFTDIKIHSWINRNDLKGKFVSRRETNARRSFNVNENEQVRAKRETQIPFKGWCLASLGGSLDASAFNTNKKNKKSEAKGNFLTYNLATYHRSNQDTFLVDKPVVSEGEWIQSGDLIADCASSVGGELAIGHNIVVAYMPWEGYNYEDAILINQRLVYEDIYTSIHIERYEIETKETKSGYEQITKDLPDIDPRLVSHLNKNGIARLGSWIEEGDILVGKVTPFDPKNYTSVQRFLFELFDKQLRSVKDSSLRAPKGIKAHVIKVNIVAKQKIKISSSSDKKTKHKRIAKAQNTNENAKYEWRPSGVHVYLAEKRKIQVGDKMAGRHGNKGIVSRILPRQDMPFLPDGTPVDIVLNPLGVPSRMNVGQIYECLLGLAGRYLGEHYKIPPFDELYGADASRSFVFSKLFEARKKTGLEWLFDQNSPGKIRLFDGRSSECFDQTVTVGLSYILKLVHMVDDKQHARSTGPYSLVTQQPLRGRSKQGGQRLGEMEVWAIEGYGAAFVLSEMLTIKSDNMSGRQTLWVNLINNKNISLGTPESFKVLVCELQALCLDIGLFRQADHNQFNTTAQNGVKAKSMQLTQIDSLLRLA